MESKAWSLINKNLKFETSDIDEDFLCSKCKNLMEFPVEAPCSHLFCLKCIENEPSCLIDQESLADFKPFVSKAFKKRILKVKIKCPTDAKTCKWTGSIDELEEHLTMCDYLLIYCELNCGCHIERIQYKTHKTQECQERMIFCKFCQSELKAKKLQGHYDVCPKVELPCPNNCTDECYFSRDNIETHLKKCSHSLLICPFHDIKIKRMEMETHFNSNILDHFLLSFEKISQLTKENKQLKEDLQNVVNEKILELKNENKELKDNFAEQIFELKNIVGTLVVENKKLQNAINVSRKFFWELNNNSVIEKKKKARSTSDAGWVGSNEITLDEYIDQKLAFEIRNGWCQITIIESPSTLTYPGSPGNSIVNQPFSYNLFDGKINGSDGFPRFNPRETVKIEMHFSKFTLMLFVNGQQQNKTFPIPQEIRLFVDIYHAGTEVEIKK